MYYILVRLLVIKLWELIRVLVLYRSAVYDTYS